MCIDQTMEEDMALKIGNYDDYGEEGVASTYIWTSWGEGHMYVNYRVIFPSIICLYSIQFNSIQFIDQLRALKGQQENCTYTNKQYAQ